MEKRNFVTSFRTAESSDIGDSLVDSTKDLFKSASREDRSMETYAVFSELEKRSSAEDEKTDRSDMI